MPTFEDIYRTHATRLYNLAYRMAGEAEADDLLQEIFLQAHRKLESFRGQSSIGTWLYRLAMNLCLDFLRSKQSKMKHVTDALDDERIGADGAALRDRRIERLDLERAIETLPDSYRAAFVLHDIEGLEHKEVGEALGIAEGTSKSLVHKARLRLRAELLRVK